MRRYNGAARRIVSNGGRLPGRIRLAPAGIVQTGFFGLRGTGLDGRRGQGVQDFELHGVFRSSFIRNLSQNYPRVRRERFSRSSRREERRLVVLNERRATPKCAKIAPVP